MMMLEMDEKIDPMYMTTKTYHVQPDSSAENL